MTAGKNAFDGYVPSVPQGEKLDYASDRCNELETLGAEAELPQAWCRPWCRTGGMCAPASVRLLHFRWQSWRSGVVAVP